MNCIPLFALGLVLGVKGVALGVLGFALGPHDFLDTNMLVSPTRNGRPNACGFALQWNIHLQFQHINLN